MRFVLAQRIEHTQMRVVVPRDERQGHCFMIAQRNESIAHALRNPIERMIRDGAWQLRPQRIGQTIVTAQARDFLGEIALACDVAAPRRWRYRHAIRSAALHAEADRYKQSL